MKTALLFFLLLVCASLRAQTADVWGIPPTAAGVTIIKSMTWYGTWSKYSRFASASGNEYNSATSMFNSTTAGASGSPPTGTINYGMTKSTNGTWLFEKSYPYRLEYGMAINYQGTQYYTMFGWIAAVKKPTAANETPAPAQQGPFDSNNIPVSNGGDPVDFEGDPTTPAEEHKAPVTLTNPFSYPATPIITLTDPQGNPLLDDMGLPMEQRGPTLQPGQSLNYDLTSDEAFGYMVDWDLGDGLTAAGTNGYSTPTGNTPPSGTGVTQTSPVNTPGLNTPAAASDTTGAVNRVGDILKLYGDDAKTARNIANNSLDALKKFAGDIKAKMDEAASVEGEQLEKLGEIAGNTEGGTTTAPGGPSPGPLPEVEGPPDMTAPADNLGDMAGIKADMAQIGDSLAGLVGALGLSANYGATPWEFVFNTRWGTFSFDVESSAGWFMDILRALFLGIMSLHFVWRLILTIRGAMVS
jgi:hypothetical protein